MSRAGIARNVAVVAAGGGLYVISVYTGYTYYMMSRKEPAGEFSSLPDAMQPANNHSCTTSHIHNPLRSNRYNTIARVYDDEIGRDEFYTGINLLRRWMLYFHARGTVLEVGAGTGRNIFYYPKAVRRVVLTDNSQEMLQQAKDKIRQMPLEKQNRFAVLQADAMTLKTETVTLPDNGFDTVVDTFGLCSYNDPVAVLKQMARVCKQNGRILLLEHGRSKTYDFVTNHLDKHAEHHAAKWGCVWNRDLDAILEECVRQGFLKVETKRIWHFGTTYYVICRPV
jgi:methyltransferase OMS1